MPDPITIGAAVGWGVSAVGWLASPIISRVLNKSFAHLDFNASEKLETLDEQVLQLQRVMEVVDESTYRVRLEPLLNKLRSAFYEAEDILDRVEYQSLKKQSLEKQIQDAKSDASMPPRKMDLLRKKLRSAMSRCLLKDEESGMSKLQLEKSLKKIESAISDSCKVLEQLKLPSASNDNGNLGRRAVAAATTAGPPLRVIGRDKDRDKIIAMLHENHGEANTVSGTCYSVIGIHGIAGSGKSTLAQCVYAHEKKKGHFDIVMWIHVSQKFTPYSIFSEMLEGATGKACPVFESPNKLKENLEEELRGKQILLVLDDVWYNIENSEYRQKLKDSVFPLNVGKAGSRILVTSRTKDALVTLGAVQERCIPISVMDPDAFVEMFMHYALPDASISVVDRIKLEEIGKGIAEKLERSPLAARIVGSRLRETPTVEFWMGEKSSDLLNSTMGALWLSYQYLDEQVRRCFAYCSIFPRRHRLKRDELVKLWVAEGFIRSSKPGEDMEHVANKYFEQLLSASFLQLGGKEKSFESYSYKRDVDYFTIHDLLYDLAEEVAGRDCFKIEKGCTGKVPQDVRYLFVEAYDRDMFAMQISGIKKLRTLIINDRIPIRDAEDFASMFPMLTGLRKLRVLKLLAWTMRLLEFSIPDSIGHWKHLRYFTLVVDKAVYQALPHAGGRFWLVC